MVTIIGAGLAGLSAALTLAEQGISCYLISQFPSERAQSVLAEGGINAALDTMGEHDTPEEHFADTMRGGADLADPNAVAALTYAAPGIVRRMYALGVPFHQERGTLILRNFGGQKKKRTAYARSSTGKALMTALIDEVRKHEAQNRILRLPRHELTALAIGGGVCRGAFIRDRFTGHGLRCPAPVILATGGLNGLFPDLTTGTVYNTSHAAALAFLSGAAFGNPEMIQYHPTTVAIPGKRLLVSEAARGEGGRLCVMRSGKPWYFMEELYPELGNLMPRDVVSRTMVRVCAREDCERQAYLDLTGLGAEIWRSKLPDLREELLHYLNLDPKTQRIPVSPGIHFFMGGLLVDTDHRTTLPGLYAAGECACQYHGANRLGGNSTLAALYGGSVAARSAAGEADHDAATDVSADAAEVSPTYAHRLGSLLHEGLGIIRDEEHLSHAAREVDALLSACSTTEQSHTLLGKAMLLAALARKESRGAHCRSDYPDRDDVHFHKTSVAKYQDGQITISFQEIPERRDMHG